MFKVYSCGSKAWGPTIIQFDANHSQTGPLGLNHATDRMIHDLPAETALIQPEAAEEAPGEKGWQVRNGRLPWEKVVWEQPFLKWSPKIRELARML